MKSRSLSVVALFTIARAGVFVLLAGESAAFVPLFPKDGVPEGWVVRRWAIRGASG